MSKDFTIDPSTATFISDYLNNMENPLTTALAGIVSKYGSPDSINHNAVSARSKSSLLRRLRNIDSPYLADLEWLISERDKGSFIAISDYRRKVFGDAADKIYFNECNAVTLEISALQYFPWLIAEAKRAIEREEIMPGRYIRVRRMKEQEEDRGDILAIAAAMQIIGASYVESLDTKGVDGSNIHLCGPETITGYFGGIGQPNDYVCKWVDELLYYYTHYGIEQFLNINFGTILAGLMLYKMGINVYFKISVFTGHDNPYTLLWTLIMAKLFAREDGSTPLAGINFSNSVNNDTITKSSAIRHAFGFEHEIRFEHHITEAYKSIVKQPYNRRDELIEIASEVPNIAAKHEGGDPDIEETRDRPSDILDYFRAKEEIVESGEMEAHLANYLDKHEAVNRTAHALTENKLAFKGAANLHRL
ncbi:MAG: hypothetical protein ACNA7Z_00270 [Dethiobacteria bacterium]|nr:hypothetical protein [Bacillota bacterium]